MNILILSAGTRNQLVRYFRNAVGGAGTVVAADMSPLAPALYEADRRYIVPRMTDPGYTDVLLDICRKERIDGVLSLIDPELSLLAENEGRFRAVGTTVVGSDLEACEMSLDKMRMYEFCRERGYRTAASWNDPEAFRSALREGLAAFPAFVKPQRGSASVAVSKVYSEAGVDLLFARESRGGRLMIQEFLDGQEIGADVYIDLISGETVSIFTKKKILMRAGETDKSVSFKDGRLFGLIERFVGEAGYRGPIDIDLFDVGGRYYISEVNPRFGGGYPHAHECGADHVRMLLNNLAGIVNPPSVGHYEEGVYMMKYNEAKVGKIPSGGGTPRRACLAGSRLRRPYPAPAAYEAAA